MVDLNKIPKLLYKKNWDAYSKRDKEDKLTKEDIDDWFETFEWFITSYTSKSDYSLLFFECEKGVI